MSKSTMILVLSAAVVLSARPCPCLAGAEALVLDHVTGLISGDTVAGGCPVRFTIRLENTTINVVTGSTNGFRVWTHRNGAYTSSYAPIQFDTLPIGWDTIYDGGIYTYPFGVNGIGADTVAFAGFRIVAGGIPNGFNQPVWWIETSFAGAGDGDTLCLDSAFYPPDGQWLWGTVPSGPIRPDWSGPYCFHMWYCPCGPPEFVECPSHLEFFTGDTARHVFCATDPVGTPGLPYDFRLTEGPGALSMVNDSCTEWTFVVPLSDGGSSRNLWLEVFREGNCALCEVAVDFTLVAPAFTAGCGDTVAVSAGNAGGHQLTVNSQNSGTGPPYIAAVDRAPSGSYGIDDAGLLTFSTDPNDRGHYGFTLCTTNGPDTVCCPVYFFVTNSVCLNRGNADGIVGIGGPIDVLDVLYLGSYLFLSGPPPACMDEGNTDGLLGAGGPVDVADLTYLVAYVFQEGPAPPVCP